MVFTTLISFIIVGLAIAINMSMNESLQKTLKHFETPFYGGRIGILVNSSDEVLGKFCPDFIKDMTSLHEYMSIFVFIVTINTLGMTTQVIQKLVIFRIKDNVTLNYVHLSLETSIAVIGLLCINLWNNVKVNSVISDTCGRVGTVSGANSIDKVYSL